MSYDFTIERDSKNGFRGALGIEPSMHTHQNKRLEQAINELVEALPDDQDIKVTVKGDLTSVGEGKTHKITITAESVHKTKEVREEPTEEEKKAGIAKKREVYQREGFGRLTYYDAGRYAVNDQGQVTDINALPVGSANSLRGPVIGRPIQKTTKGKSARR